MNLSVDDSFPNYNRAQIYTALATVTNHYVDGFYADVTSTNPNAIVHAFYVNNGKSRFKDTVIDGTLFIGSSGLNQIIQLYSCGVANHG